MTASRTVATLTMNRGGLSVITGNATGRRYTFTWNTREQPIDPRDADQFRSLILQVTTCACGGGEPGLQIINLFEVEERP